MSDYLPDAYTDFRTSYPEVAARLDDLGEQTRLAGPIDGLAQHLVKLGIAVGALAEGAVRSHARQAVGAGASPAAVRQVAVLAITTAGFPTAIAALGWIDEVLANR